MTLLACWLLFPVVLCLIFLGLGLLVDRISGHRVPGVLLLPVGFAASIVVGQLTTATDVTAELTTPVIVLLTLGGIWVERDRISSRQPDWWVAGSAAAVFAVYAAPIVLSGDATFAGYIKLDDTSTWMTFTDWVMTHGPGVDGLAPSSYEATLQINLSGGYPTGGFVPLGVGHQLTGQDVAWTIQPFMALLAAMLALALAGLLRPLVSSRRLLAVAIFIAAQPAVLYGYYLWGGIKEIETAALLAMAPPLALIALKVPGEPRSTVPLAVAVAGLLGVLGLGAGVWVVALLLPAFALSLKALGGGEAVRRAVVFGALITVLSLPVVVRGIDALVSGGSYSPTGSNLPGNPLGNLLGPLNTLQVAGLWPAADFRIDPSHMTVTYILIAIAAVAAGFGLWAAVESRKWSLPIYVGGLLVGGVVISAVGIPWVDGKVIASASPAILAAACAGAAILVSREMRIEGGLLMALLGVGVLWSTALAYPEVNLGPREELVELQKIGKQIEGQGPTLMTDNQIYGVRHFLRDADPEGVKQLRRRPITLLDGTTAERSLPGGTDEIALPDVLTYRTIVTRRSPAQSRPPLPYSSIYRGKYYDVWQAPAVPNVTVLEHLPLGGEADSGGVPDCAEVRRLAKVAGTSGRLVAAPARNVGVLQLSDTEHPAAWAVAGRDYLQPGNDAGVIEARIRVPGSGRQDIWMGGSLRGRLSVKVDGRELSALRHQLLADVGYTLLGTDDLRSGEHTITMSYSGKDLHPGSAKSVVLGYPIGPLVVASDPSGQPVTSVSSSKAGQLCGKRWDWVEAVRP